ncbi:MAG: BTAD domain-containing putative transcriptional regulator [Acidimicrobiia bacterium]
MERLQYRVLGPLEVMGSDGPIDLGAPRQQKVLALLLCSPDRVISTDRLIDEIWGDAPPEKAKHSLQTYISNLRRTLGPVIETRRPGYVIRVDAGELDSLMLEQALDADGNSVREALKLWRGEPFAGLTEHSPMLQAEAARLGELRLNVWEAQIESDLAAGEHDRLIGRLEKLTSRYPLRERFWGARMIALYRSGRQSEALRSYQDARRILGEQLGIEPSPELLELEERILMQDPGLAWQPSEAPVPNNLPSPISSFVGRETELLELSKLLEEARLVTVSGPAGSGKTRLARELGASMLDQFPDGVWLVPLGPLREGSLIPTEILGILGMDAPAKKTHLEALRDQLGGRDALLIIDNCEHVLFDAAQVVVSVLHAAPAVKVLATSREPLGVTGEVVWSLSPMGLPADIDVTPTEATNAEAVRLFVDRASAVLPAFHLNDANVRLVVQICRRLDGLPLAIELAAARARSLGIDQIDLRLQGRIDLLSGGDPTALDRHQTLLGAVEWSYDLLHQAQRELYRRLSVLAGGFTQEAAEQVGASATNAAEAILDLLSGLVGHSVIDAQPTGAGIRYRMLETIRAHALTLLDESEEGASAPRRAPAMDR